MSLLLCPFYVFLYQVDRHRDHLINYIIFLRITPFLPNWFINITSPVINVPLGVFFIGTFIGKMLLNYFFFNPQIGKDNYLKQYSVFLV